MERTLGWTKTQVKVFGRLLDSAFTFLNKTINILIENSKTYRFQISDISEDDLKEMVTASTTALELLFKVKIVCTDWRLLFTKTSDASEEKLNNGHFKSVKPKDCIRIFEKSFSINFDPAWKTHIDKLSSIKNKNMHYFYRVNYYESAEDHKDVLYSIYKSIDIFIEFYRTYLLKDIYEEEDRTKNIDSDLSALTGYPAMRMETLRTQYQGYDIPRTHFWDECQTCFQKSFILKDCETVFCIYCNVEWDISSEAKDRSSFNHQIKRCSQCGRNSMTALHKSDAEAEAWDCTICGFYINKPTKWTDGFGKHYTDSITDECRNLPTLQVCENSED
jgi:hypothetical protein